LAGVRAKKASQKFGTPYLFLQPLELSTSNLVYKLGLGVAYQKQLLGPKLAVVRAREASQKNWDPVFIFAVIEASKFKFAIQLGLGQ